LKTSKNFTKQQYLQQEAFFATCDDAHVGYMGQAVRLLPDSWTANLHPDYRTRIVDSFAFRDDDTQAIGWHTHANHGASSQVCCVNFLFPLADKPELLGRWIDHVLGISGAKPEVIERRNGEEHYIAFEWFPATDYLNEASKAGVRNRGSNSTSVDAAVCYHYEGERRLLLIEWKYTECYPAARMRSSSSGDVTRLRRYNNIWQRPHGPIRADAAVELEEFFLEPWYQLLRQQMTAYHAETDPLSEYDHAMLLHISPLGNTALRRSKGTLARYGDTVFEAFSSLLDCHYQDRFKFVDTAHAFACLANWQSVTWFKWLEERYPALTAIGKAPLSGEYNEIK